MRTVKRPEIRKQEILEGAMDVFLRKGYEKTTIADIAKELGISQGLCYRYFASKEEIYDAVIDSYARFITQAHLQHRPGHQPIGDWIEGIPCMLERMADTERENPRLYALLHGPRQEDMHNRLCMKVGEQLIPAVTEVLEQAKACGEIQLADCRRTAIFGVYGEIGLLINTETDCADAIREHWRMLLNIK